jgi:hypothetical protein
MENGPEVMKVSWIRITALMHRPMAASPYHSNASSPHSSTAASPHRSTQAHSNTTAQQHRRSTALPHRRSLKNQGLMYSTIKVRERHPRPHHEGATAGVGFELAI